jgi:phenylacetate-coenzyme A ligase PaaK-like adenylate-forming protein
MNTIWNFVKNKITHELTVKEIRDNKEIVFSDGMIMKLNGNIQTEIGDKLRVQTVGPSVLRVYKGKIKIWEHPR